MVRTRTDLASTKGRTLSGACLAHILHDGYSDLIYVLLPVWQEQFALGFAALALVRTLYVGALAALQIPASRLAHRFGARMVLGLGTLLSAGGYGLAGASGGLAGLCTALVIGGIGASTQHPLASSLISRAYGSAARGPLGTYNFAGDLGKATVPPLVTLLLVFLGWRGALWVIAAVGVAVALAVAWLLPKGPDMIEGRNATQPMQSSGEVTASDTGFGLLVAIGMLDNAARPAFLLYLPFLLQEKGAALTTVGLAFSLVFVGGALGKAVCGRLGAKLGVIPTVVATEAGTAVAIMAVVMLPLAPVLILLPVLGVMLNGTSSVLYGTVPELAPGGRVERAFAVFYTFTLSGSALATPLIYGRLGDHLGPHGAVVAAAATAFAVVPLALALAPFLRAGPCR
ncbi:MFS transporter [Beijerinckia sp. L45]|uniref:MFS transporter n=1 Tax=Beijerinckia sp. L45 TaxID=1641855 RepID=UPI00131BF164|nr:MFS transporter [Beijerinckia sp. L45]